MPKQKKISKKRWLSIVAKLAELEPPKIEEQKQCFHMNLTKFIADDHTYQCDECKSVFDVVGAAMYNPRQYVIKSAIVMQKLAKSDPEVGDILKGFMTEYGKENGGE